jgi:LacI family transcriptional regulator
VSDRAGVSVGTVSNVLNAPHLVASPTRSRVLRVIDELDYRPSRAARSLQAKRSYLIGYRLPNAGRSPALDVFLHSLVAAASGYGLEIALFAPKGNETELDAYRRLIRSGDVDGLILTETNYHDDRIAMLIEERFPFASFGGAVVPSTFSWVDVDGAAGMGAVAHHLVERGHRRIVLVGWPEGSKSGDDRVHGFQSALHGVGLEVTELVRVDGGFRNGYEIGSRLFSDSQPPTAVAAVEDELGLGLMAAASAAGLKVGGDVAIAGFDDSVAARLVSPGLTSVRQPMDQVASMLIDALVSTLAGDGEQCQTLLAPQLVIRGSTG